MTDKTRHLKEKLHAFFSNPYTLNTSFLIGEKCARILSSLFIGIWTANYLGKTDFGFLNYALSLTGIFLPLSTLGMESVLIKEMVNKPSSTRSVLSNAACIRGIGSIIAICILNAIIYMTHENLQERLIIGIVSLTLPFYFSQLYEYYYLSRVKGRFIAAAKLISLFISCLIKVYLIQTQRPLSWFAASVLFEAIILSQCLSILKSHENPQRLFSLALLRLKESKRLIKKSMPLLFSGLVVGIYLKIDQIMIQQFLGSADLGIYVAAVKISESIYFLPVIISQSVFPAIIAAGKISPSLYNRRIQLLAGSYFWISILISTTLTAFSNQVFSLLYTAEYYTGASILQIHIWASIFVFVSTLTGKVLVNQNLQKYILCNTIIGAVLNIGLNLLLLPTLGSHGAAWSTVISYGIAAYLGLLFWPQTRKTFFIISKSFIPIRIRHNE